MVVSTAKSRDWWAGHRRGMQDATPKPPRPRRPPNYSASPAYLTGFREGAEDYLRSPRERRGYGHLGHGRYPWMYRRGFARGFLAAAEHVRMQARGA